MDTHDVIRIDFPVYGPLRDRAADLLEQGVRQGGIFLQATDVLQPGAALQMMFVDEHGEEQFYVNTFVTKVRRSEPEQVFVCFARLKEARDALARIKELVVAAEEASLVTKSPQVEEPEEPDSLWDDEEASLPTSEPAPAPADALETAQVLVVHPDLLTREKISQELQGEGFQVCTTDDGLNALVVLEAFDADAIIAWARTDRIPGYELPKALRQRTQTKNMAILILCESGDDDGLDLAKDSGADGVLEYPVPTEEIARSIREVISSMKPA